MQEVLSITRKLYGDDGPSSANRSRKFRLCSSKRSTGSGDQDRARVSFGDPQQFRDSSGRSVTLGSYRDQGRLPLLLNLVIKLPAFDHSVINLPPLEGETLRMLFRSKFKVLRSLGVWAGHRSLDRFSSSWFLYAHAHTS